MHNFPSELPPIRITQVDDGPSRIECQEMFGCLPRVGFTSSRAEYYYPQGSLVSVRRFRVQCRLVYAGLDVYEIAELPEDQNDLENLWYFGLSDKGVHCLRYVVRHRHKVGHIDDYQEAEEPADPRWFEAGFSRDFEWTEFSGDERASWQMSDRVTGPVVAAIGPHRFQGLCFTSMVRFMDGRPMHLDTDVIDRSGHRVLMRRWEGEGNERMYQRLADCEPRHYGGHNWRHHYDVITDVGWGLRGVNP